MEFPKYRILLMERQRGEVEGGSSIPVASMEFQALSSTNVSYQPSEYPQNRKTTKARPQLGRSGKSRRFDDLEATGHQFEATGHQMNLRQTVRQRKTVGTPTGANAAVSNSGRDGYRPVNDVPDDRSETTRNPASI